MSSEEQHLSNQLRSVSDEVRFKMNRDFCFDLAQRES